MICFLQVQLLKYVFKIKRFIIIVNKLHERNNKSRQCSRIFGGKSRKSSLRDDCHHVIRYYRDCHGMINASVRCPFSMIEEGLGDCGTGGGVARAGECIYMYTETANKHSADLNNVSPNRILQRCDVVAFLLEARNLVYSKYRFIRHSRARENLTHCKNNIARRSYSRQ